jgi:hypothetical protein
VPLATGDEARQHRRGLTAGFAAKEQRNWYHTFVAN